MNERLWEEADDGGTVLEGGEAVENIWAKPSFSISGKSYPFPSYLLMCSLVDFLFFLLLKDGFEMFFSSI